MPAIKSFLYLDEYKMYSISSQIFEGITEYLVDYQGTTQEGEERQSGPLGSGRVMADILKSESKTQERRYLHDYSYSLFENRLKTDEMVLSISAENLNETVEKINGFGFVEVRGRALFNDMNMIKSTLNQFNSLGTALAYITKFGQTEDVRQQLDRLTTATEDRNQKARLRHTKQALAASQDQAKARGLYQDPTFLEKLALLLDYGFQDQFEVQMRVGEYLFSANLKREYLREKDHLLIRKYSRLSDQDFVLFGTVAQGATRSGDVIDEDREEIIEESEPQHVKEVIMSLVKSLSEIESTFSGKLANEVVIDPIALYREL